MLVAGAYQALLDEAERHWPPEGLPPDEGVRMAMQACQAAACTRAWGRAVTWADRGLSLEAGRREDRGILRYLAGTALIYTGDLPRAGRELARFRREAQRVSALRRLLGDALYNEAYLMRAMGRPDDEVTLFREAARAYTELGRTERATICWYEVAWSLLLAGRPDDAEAHLPAVEAAAAGHPDPEFPADVALARALYWHLKENRAECDEICRQLIASSELPGRQEADLCWIMARQAFARGDRQAALLLTERAAEAACGNWWPPQMERIRVLQRELNRGTASHV